jgi:hypothetical protein
MREVVREIIEGVTGKKVNSPSVAEWLYQWIRSEDGAVAPHTLVRYRQVVLILAPRPGNRYAPAWAPNAFRPRLRL